jgi:16S rRNA (cytosine967-C5)-methyltransferase
MVLVPGEAAQLISCLVNPQRREYVLDLCAAPGGKTTHLAQLMRNEGNILALDMRHESARFSRKITRLGASIIALCLADVTDRFPY